MGATAAERIEELRRAEELDRNPCYALTANLPGAPAEAPAVDITIHTADGVLLVEMEPSGREPSVAGRDGDYFSMVSKTIGRLKNTQTLAEFCEVVAREARSITGLDRAMVYRFHADDSGEVMADARREDLPSWHGLRYPAGDIPKPAREHLQYRIHLDAVHLAVLARAAGEGQLTLTSPSSPNLLDGIMADGVAIFQQGAWFTAGRTPDKEQLIPLAAWLRARIESQPDGAHVYASDALGAAYPAATGFAEVASGVPATAVSRHADSLLLLWFRAEQVQTFKWAGNPHEKPTAIGPLGPRLTPRRSFELWQEQVRGHSSPWRSVEVEAGQQLRRMVMDLVVVRTVGRFPGRRASRGGACRVAAAGYLADGHAAQCAAPLLESRPHGARDGRHRTRARARRGDRDARCAARRKRCGGADATADAARVL